MVPMHSKHGQMLGAADNDEDSISSQKHKVRQHMEELGFKQAPLTDLLVQPAKLQNYQKERGPAFSKLASEKNRKTPADELNTNFHRKLMDEDCRQSQ